LYFIEKEEKLMEELALAGALVVVNGVILLLAMKPPRNGDE